jgi:hypothetical protein
MARAWGKIHLFVCYISWVRYERDCLTRYILFCMFPFGAFINSGVYRIDCMSIMLIKYC